MIVGIDHVNISIPPGEEDEARSFYAGVLGLTEIPKPAVLAGRGGVWFAGSGVHVHLGTAEGFEAPARAHVGFLVDDVDALAARLTSAGHDVAEAPAAAGGRRFFARDPFGNRLEFLAVLD